MIEFRDVCKRYGTLVANDHLSLAIRKGELMTLLGPSGCGKTTALRCLTGYIRPDEGRIFIDGQDITDVPTHQRELGMVFQNFALFPHMTVQDNVGFPLMIRSLSTTERAERVAQALRLVRLEGYESHYPRQLSGGQQQRVGLARALVYRPKVLLLDEPLSNLDAKLREEMRFEIKEVVTRLEITAVYVTHDQAEALALSDRVAIMNRGRLEQVGTPEEIYEHPRSRFVAEFIGLSNFLEGHVQAVDGDIMVVSVGGLQMRIPALPNAGQGQRVLLFLRPNEVELLRPDDPGGANVFDAQVEKATYLGDTMDYRLTFGQDMTLRVQSDAQRRFGQGAPVRIRFPRVRCWAMTSG
ncbi:MAG: ABC transporter ATP-binding protein [candidate division NC10 bacterium]|nr:ABC transporter ATP-binding protein [candidate division NC10 bacterium]MBI2454513.1 ABC transporter ATP-binding protein [candidate division NC10 bacterium]